jgi:hypothetical protein
MRTDKVTTTDGLIDEVRIETDDDHDDLKQVAAINALAKALDELVSITPSRVLQNNQIEMWVRDSLIAMELDQRSEPCT